MTSYNAINGTPSPADTYTANELLQRTYGFDGYTTSDCGAVGDVYAAGSHDWAPPGWTTDIGGRSPGPTPPPAQQIPAAAGGQAYALRAGTAAQLHRRRGHADEHRGRDQRRHAVARASSTTPWCSCSRCGWRPASSTRASKVPYTKITKTRDPEPGAPGAGREGRRQRPGAAEERQRRRHQRTAAARRPGQAEQRRRSSATWPTRSPSATTPATRRCRSTPCRASPPRSRPPTRTPRSPSTPAAPPPRPPPPASCSAQTQAAIKTADLVIVFVGTDLNVATEGNDRDHAGHARQLRLADQPGRRARQPADGAGASSPTARSTIDDVQGDFPAIVFSGYNGESQGTALADVLFGQQNPAGHLDFTWYAGRLAAPAR